MTTCDPTAASPAGVAGPEPEDLQGRLDTLRARLSGLGPDKPLENLISKVSETVERITAEHEGMAEELLTVYEQLGVIFEVTSKLSSVQSETGVVDLFVASLDRSFSSRDVSITLVEAEKAVKAPTGDNPSTGWLDLLIHRAATMQCVVVEPRPDEVESGGVVEVMAGPVFSGESFVCVIVLSRNGPRQPFRACDMLLLESLTLFCGDLIRNHRLLHELREMSISMVRSLVNAVDQKDQYTSGHSIRVGFFATLLGKELGLGDIDLQMLQWSALLHDVGKIGIRDNVLNKSGRLTPDEFEHIKEHPVRSYRVVQEVPQLTKALEGVLHHHERYDGTGYPDSLEGEQIPLQARIVQIGDIFDALTSDRAYRTAYHWERALEILGEEAGKTVDPTLQKTFERVVHELLDDDPDGWNRLIQHANRFDKIGAAGDEDSREN